MTRIACALMLALVAAPAAAQDDHPNQSAGAKPLTPAGLAGRIEVGGDRDVFRLEAVAGREYHLETSDLAEGMDSLLDLYEPSGQHLLRDDDGAGNLASRIEFRATATATYWVLVSHYQRSTGTGRYRVSARELNAPAPTTPTTPTTPGPAAAAGSLEFARVFDPKLAGASLPLTYRLDAATTIQLEVRDGAGRLVRTLASGARPSGPSLADWDGTDAQGLFVAPGSYEVQLRAGTQTLARGPLAVVRLGIRALSFGGSARVPLSYHRADGSATRLPLDQIGPAWTLASSALGAGCLDRADGSPLDLPARWANLDAPPRTGSGALVTRGISLPAAYTLGARPQAKLLFGDAAAVAGSSRACGYPIPGVALRVAVEGGLAPGAQSGELLPGGETSLDLPALPSAIGKERVRYRFRFYYQAGSAWLPLAGAQETDHTVYLTAALPSTELAGRRPWVAALDLAARWAAGQTSAREAMSAVVRGVNGDLGLRYDVDTGAPAYTDGWELQNPELDLDAFLDDLDNGRVVNCLDCASLVTKLAAQLGVQTQIAILGWDFRLNFLRGIGSSQFTNGLFGGYHAFSYHAVATTDQGRTLDDACLELDDDARPYAAPFSARLPTAIDFNRYRQQLSPDAFRLRELGRATLR